MKFVEQNKLVTDLLVAPYAGAGIEISLPWGAFSVSSVAPYAGAGIEIGISSTGLLMLYSRPLRGGGN